MIGRVLVAVAADTAADAFVLMDRPFWQVLYTFHHLEERAHRRALHDRLARVDAGYMAARAFNAPATLDDELRTVLQAIEAQDRDPVDHAAELHALRERGEALAARIEHGRVLSPAALLS